MRQARPQVTPVADGPNSGKRRATSVLVRYLNLMIHVLRLMRLSLAGLALMLPAGSVLADVAYTRTIKAGGPVAAGGGGSAVVSILVSGDKQRSDTRSLTGGLNESIQKLGVLGAGEIVRLDGGRVYSLQPDSQSLTEETLSERRERLDRLAQSRGEPLPFKDVSSDIRPTGAQDTVNGFPCDEVVITVRGSFEDPATRQRTPVALEGDVWMASSFAGKSEIERFGRKYAEGLGFDPSSAVQSAMIDPRYVAALKEFSRAISQVSGLPIRATLVLSGVYRSLPAGKLLSGDGGAQPDQGNADQTGSSSGGPAPRFISPDGGVARLKTGLVTRSDVHPASALRKPPPNGDWTLVSEITEVKEGPVDPASFEPPKDYKRLVPDNGEHAKQKSQEPSISSPSQTHTPPPKTGP